MTTTAITAAEAIAEWERQLAALGEMGDVPNTYNNMAEYARKQSALMGKIRTASTSLSTLAEVEPKISDLTKWRDHEIDWRQTCLAKLETLDPKDPKRYGWELSLRRIEFGLDFMNEALPARLPLDDLMAASGFVPADPVARAQGDAWYGSLPEVEHRLRDLEARAADARLRLRFVLADTV